MQQMFSHTYSSKLGSSPSAIILGAIACGGTPYRHQNIENQSKKEKWNYIIQLSVLVSLMTKEQQLTNFVMNVLHLYHKTCNKAIKMNKTNNRKIKQPRDDWKTRVI